MAKKKQTKMSKREAALLLLADAEVKLGHARADLAEVAEKTDAVLADVAEVVEKLRRALLKKEAI